MAIDYYLFKAGIFRSVGLNKQKLVNHAKEILKRVFTEIFESGCDISIDKVVDIKGDLPLDEQIVVVNEIQKVLARKKIGVFLRSPQIAKALKKYRDAKEAKQGGYALQSSDEIAEPEEEEGSESLSEWN